MVNLSSCITSDRYFFLRCSCTLKDLSRIDLTSLPYPPEAQALLVNATIGTFLIFLGFQKALLIEMSNNWGRSNLMPFPVPMASSEVSSDAGNFPIRHCVRDEVFPSKLQCSQTDTISL